ncbi:efflux transporter, outer membrane factor (OMF) lipoprotein, NodT family [Flexibacter flexilis DSM 6793]|uniref:Efflux transporter, outer membrane factor (OMF) lipoprotein, NodT family n=1 Tax=Flexibacter flexilis DSM 6793 TaxID=927664 RepID=A0A1I1E4B5_9BACT|nr:efflux transporter outer membrane subunit [Flexibacter flexilis]SFB79770.1 efflux transporter, outer membrane factor (OMF) lipoprotein, NodT family [Flexibacter flexilis DSM 6793]
MKQKVFFAIYSLVLGFVFVGCQKFNTNLSISQKPIPQHFGSPAASADTATIADLNWRTYFADSLLIGLIDTALVNNLDLQIALQRIEMARATKQGTWGAILPQVEANVGGGLRKFGLYTMDGAGNATTEITPGKLIPENLPDMYVGLQASWEVDIWGKLHTQRKAAVANYLASLEGRNFVASCLVTDIASAYYELVALDNELDILNRFVEKQKEALDVIQTQKNVGRANQLAVQQFEAQLLSAQAMETETKQQIIQTQNFINFLLGRYPQAIKRNKTGLFRETPAQIATGVPSQLLTHRPDIREATFALQATKFDLQAAKMAFLPSLNITAGLGFQAFNPKYLFWTPASLAYSALGSLAAPLINRNALKAQFSTAKASQLAAMYAYQKTILNAYVEVANQVSNLENIHQVYWLKKQQTDILASAVETSTELYRTAKANYLEILFAQQNSLQAQLELVGIAKRKQMATVNIYRTLGGGWR